MYLYMNEDGCYQSPLPPTQLQESEIYQGVLAVFTLESGNFQFLDHEAKWVSVQRPPNYTRVY